MELVFTKKLLQETISKEIEEQGTDPAAAQPEAGTSDTQAGGQGYPQVGKWESGVGREGPANQIGVTKWADVVGAKLVRGKANPLKEQEVGMQPGRTTQIAQTLNAPEIERKKKIQQNFNDNFIAFKTPHSSQVKEGTHIILPKSVNGKVTTFTKYQHPINPKEIFKSWIGTQWDSYIPTEEQLQDILPNDTLRSFTIDGIKYTAYLKRIDDDPITWQFLWYYNKDNKPYNQNLYIKTEQIPEEYRYSFIKEWGEDILMAASLLSAIFIPGLGGIALGVLLDLGVAGIKLEKGDTWGAGICSILAFLPVIGEIANVGRVSNKTAERLVREVGDVNSYKELVNRINSMGNTSDAYLLRQLLKDDPHRIVNLIDKFLAKNLLNKIATRGEALIVVKHLNGLLKSGKITKVSASKWYQRLGLKRLGFYIGGSIGIMLGGSVAELAYGIYINSKLTNSEYGLTESENEMFKIADGAYKSNPELYKQKIDPVINMYIDKYGKSNPELLMKVMNGIHVEFTKNPNIDPNKVGKEIESSN